MMSSVQNEQLEVTMALNQYKNGSKTLTSEVQSYAVTGDQLYYDNYMNELNVDQNREKAMASVESGDLISAQESVFGDAYEETVVQINTQTEEVIEQIQARKASQKNLLQILQIIAQIAFVASCGYVIFALVKTIQFSKKELLSPIEKVAEQMEHLAHGDFGVRMDLEEDASEVGQMVAAIRFMKKNMHEMITEISYILEEMGEGNYQFVIEKEYVGEFIEIKESIIKISEAMRETLHTMRDVAEQIDAGSEQLARQQN